MNKEKIKSFHDIFSGSQFYLVLDVINLTSQEMTLNYTENKTILIEAKESCRIPVPVERCDLDRILAEHKEVNDDKMSKNFSFHVKSNNSDTHILYLPDQMMPNGLSDVDLPEKLCAEHISKAVNLQWTLSGAETIGIATLKGISLSHTMLDLVTLAPLQWSKSRIQCYKYADS